MTGASRQPRSAPSARLRGEGWGEGLGDLLPSSRRTAVAAGGASEANSSAPHPCPLPASGQRGRHFARRFVCAAGLAIPLTLAACQQEKDPPPPIRPVLFTTIVPMTTDIFGPFASTVEARYQAQLGFQVAGRMVARDVYVGQVVRAGQRLAALDPTVIQFALARAKADVTDATAQLANTSGIEQRQRALFEGGNAPKASLDNAVAGRDTARARLDQAKAALQTAQDQLGYTQLRASFDGVVTTWSAEIGTYVANGQAVVTIARPDVREAVVDIPDEMISQVKQGMVFTVRLEASTANQTTAKVREIGPLADPATRTHRVRLSLERPPPAFRLGTTISAAVERTIPPRIVIPASAILEKDGRNFVWLIANDGASVSRREVTIGGRDGDDATIAKGLARGDRIVNVGVHSLADGQKIKIDTGAGA